jgi:hypothetical protein
MYHFTPLLLQRRFALSVCLIVCPLLETVTLSKLRLGTFIACIACNYSHCSHLE